VSEFLVARSRAEVVVYSLTSLNASETRREYLLSPVALII